MEIATKIAPIALALIMLGLGMSLTIQDFLRVIKVPKDFLVGFICQLILLPIVAFVLIKLLNTPAELAIGVMLIAAAPGGVTSNVLTKFAKGDVALSISLTAIISLISIISVPFIVFNSIDLFEINEAFAVVTLAAMKHMHIPHNKVNIHGGACALGHPLGASGSRIVVTLVHALKRLNKQRGIATLCIGGGEATAIAIELI